MGILAILRTRLLKFTIEQSVLLMRNLGGYELDKITILTHNGYRRLSVLELVEHFNGSVPVDRLKPVYFWGGPMIAKQYKGDYLTYLVDRVMYAMCERGWLYVNATIAYCEGLASAVKN